MEKLRQRLFKSILNVLASSKLSIDEMNLYSSKIENECFDYACNLCSEDNRFDLLKKRRFWNL